MLVAKYKINRLITASYLVQVCVDKLHLLTVEVSTKVSFISLQNITEVEGFLH